MYNEYNDVLARRFYEPRLHECFEANPYDTSQLPLDVDALFDVFDVRFVHRSAQYLLRVSGDSSYRMNAHRYRFSLDNLKADSVSADVVVTGSLYLWWQDAHRAWNTSEIPLSSIYIPASEIWTPALRVVHPLSSDIELAVDPASTARVAHDGSVRYWTGQLIRISNTHTCTVIKLINQRTHVQSGLQAAVHSTLHA